MMIVITISVTATITVATTNHARYCWACSSVFVKSGSELSASATGCMKLSSPNGPCAQIGFSEALKDLYRDYFKAERSTSEVMYEYI